MPNDSQHSRTASAPRASHSTKVMEDPRALPRALALAGSANVESGGSLLADATTPTGAIDLMLKAEVRIRPKTLTDAECATPQTFLEKPPVRRAPGSDRWVTSGGKAGATEMWNTPEHGVLKRYGRLIRRCDQTSVKYVQF
eukprot:COSAG02_NODE_12746_length_1500_cov_2.900785_3_plen_140_part_01